MIPYSASVHDWQGEFSNNNPIVLEIGFGDGKHFKWLSKTFPDRNFIGIERTDYPNLPKAILEGNGRNVRIVMHDANQSLEAMFEDSSVDEIVIMSPSPAVWIGILNREGKLIKLFKRKLKPGGKLIILTESFKQEYSDDLNKRHSEFAVSLARQIEDPEFSVKVVGMNDYDERWISQFGVNPGLSYNFLWQRGQDDEGMFYVSCIYAVKVNPHGFEGSGSA